jgi:hypothetical protein
MYQRDREKPDGECAPSMHLALDAEVVLLQKIHYGKITETIAR